MGYPEEKYHFWLHLFLQLAPYSEVETVALQSIYKWVQEQFSKSSFGPIRFYCWILQNIWLRIIVLISQLL